MHLLKILSINLWRLPNVSVVIGNEIESPKWEFLLFAETRLCLAYFERLKRKIYNGMTTGARTKGLHTSLQFVWSLEILVNSDFEELLIFISHASVQGITDNAKNRY